MIRRLAALSLMAVQLLGAQGLFRDSVPLELTFVTNLRDLIRNRDSTTLRRFGAAMTYRDAAGGARVVPVSLRARGHFRRQARNCRFPPLKLSTTGAAARGTLLQGNTELKITTACRPADQEYEQYILAEYALYRAYQEVSPLHFRTRLARVTYRDSASAVNDVVTWAFLIEDDEEVAKRFDLKVDTTQGATFADLEPVQLATTALFNYFAGNTDWSVAALHNIVLLRSKTGQYQPVSYDFDWSGAVDARYAFPDARLKIARTTVRLYRGPCLTEAEWQPVLARFTSARARVESVYGRLTAMDEARRQRTLAYLGEFYRTISDPRRVRRELIETCQRDGN
jgi:hypothetical protein